MSKASLFLVTFVASGAQALNLGIKLARSDLLRTAAAAGLAATPLAGVAVGAPSWDPHSDFMVGAGAFQEQACDH